MTSYVFMFNIHIYILSNKYNYIKCISQNFISEKFHFAKFFVSFRKILINR